MQAPTLLKTGVAFAATIAAEIFLRGTSKKLEWKACSAAIQNKSFFYFFI
jgi:hypothetical protein